MTEREIEAVLRAVPFIELGASDFNKWQPDYPAMARAVMELIVGPVERTRLRFPIQRGPDVPWAVMAAYESQCQRNHGQSVERLAERGGLGTGEAWAVVNGLDWFDMEKSIGWAEADRLWRQYAERVNLHYDELERLKVELADRDARLARVVEALTDRAHAAHAHAVGSGSIRHHGTTSTCTADGCRRSREALADAGAGKEVE